MQVRLSKPSDDAARDEYVLSHERGTFFHLAGWGRVVERIMRHRRSDWLAFEGDALVGVLPLSVCRSLRGKRNLISVPYGVYGGAVGRDRDVEAALFRAAESQAIDLGAGRLELRCLDDPGLDLPASDLYATFLQELPSDPAQVLAGMPKKARADARKGREKFDLRLVEGRWYLDDLVRLFHQNKRSLGSPGLPLSWFRALLEEFSDRVAVHQVRRADRPLTGVLSFLFRDQVLAYYSGSDEGADREFKASNFQYMALQEWSIEQGYRIFDFGRSRKDSGAFRFKMHQGFAPRDLHYRFRLVTDTELPSLNPSNPKTHKLQAAWRRLPLALTRSLSTPASRFLP
ncbi:MAG: FemAB family PEP-CTERM system-associated protein [Planctomycetes bacterium]|nr:FemAB family PEP-CTERM system-associated protein [Planctomycetota bacterium]HPF14383.1 FemAB family PEP-CTERM system-associated protein [Planctomycetota bacterium]HRV81886.1 FemAB family PEP-CTERM system-associated protein [Planctomycetota bacterium]